MSHSTSRRSFLQHASAATLASLAAPAVIRAAAAEKVNIACIGVGGKGWSDMHETSVGHNIVAICDIDEQRLAKAGQKFPQAKKYTDWRKLLEQKDIERVDNLLDMAMLPTRAPHHMDYEHFIELMAVDKKVRAGKINFVLFKTLGDAFVTNDFDHDLLRETIEAHRAIDGK